MILGSGCLILIATALTVGEEHPGWFLGAAVLVLAALVVWHSRAFGYRCPSCGAEFSVSAWQDFVAPRLSETRYLTCPQCKRKDWARVMAKEK